MARMVHNSVLLCKALLNVFTTASYAAIMIDKLE